MIKVKDAAAAASKFKTRAAAASPDYAAGVKDSGEAWKTGAAASAENYNAGVQAAIGRNAFAKGIQAAGSDKYVRNASGIGARRFSEGVANAEGDFAKGVAPYLDAMRQFTFATPRRPKGDPSNWQRSQELGQRLRALKTGS